MKKFEPVLFDRSASPQDRLHLLNKYEKRRSSWCICEKEFAPILEKLRSNPPDLTPESGLIYESSGKYVWKKEYAVSGEMNTVAYKTNPGKTPWRYIFKSSLPIREMRNYLIFEALNIPVAQVVAAGDERKNFILKETFIVTGFLENSRDGRVFMPGGPDREEHEKRNTFCRLNLALLAKLHHANIFHKAFHPRNLLWRNSADGMEVFWIDVARCRKVSPRKMPRAVIVDLHTFFRDMRLTTEETMELLEYYVSLAPAQYLPSDPAKLMDELIHFKRHAFGRKQYQLFSGSTLNTLTSKRFHSETI